MDCQVPWKRFGQILRFPPPFLWSRTRWCLDKKNLSILCLFTKSYDAQVVIWLTSSIQWKREIRSPVAHRAASSCRLIVHLGFEPIRQATPVEDVSTCWNSTIIDRILASHVDFFVRRKFFHTNWTNFAHEEWRTMGGRVGHDRYLKWKQRKRN